MKKIILKNIICLIILFVLTPVIVLSAENLSSDELKEEGIKSLNRDDNTGAIENFEKAVILYEKDKDYENIYTVSAYLSVLYALSDDNVNAKKYADKMMAKSPDEEIDEIEEVKDNEPEGLSRQAFIFLKKGNIKEAIEGYEKALAIYEKNNDKDNIFNISSCLATLYKSSGNEEAFKKHANRMKDVVFLNSAKNAYFLQEIEKGNMTSAQVLAIKSKAYYDSYVNSYKLPMEFFNEKYINEILYINSIQEKYNDYEGHGWPRYYETCLYLMLYYHIIGDDSKAIEIGNKLEKVMDKGILSAYRHFYLYFLGIINSEKDPVTALTMYEKAGDYDPSGISSANRFIIKLNIKHRKLNEALNIINETWTGYHDEDFNYCQGFYYLFNKEYDKAIEEFKEFQGKKNFDTSCGISTDVYTGLGIAQENLKNYKEAEQSYMSVINFIEILRRMDYLNPKLKPFLFSSISFNWLTPNPNLFCPRLSAYEGLIRVFHKTGRDKDAFYYSEHTKARLLLEEIAKKYDSKEYSIPKELSDKEKILFNSKEIGEAYYKWYDEISSIISNIFDLSNTSGVAKKKEMEQKINEIEGKQEEFLKVIRAKYPEYVAIKHPKPLKVEEIQLNPDEVVIEYEVTDTETYGWLIKDKEIQKTVTIPAGRDELTKLVEDYRNGFATVSNETDLGNFKPEAGKKLYDMLLKDLVSSITKEKIIIVPDEILGTLPFESLVCELPEQVTWGEGTYGKYPQGIKYAGDVYNITYSQSVSTLSVIRILNKNKKQDKMGILAVVDPVFSENDIRPAQSPGTAKTQENELTFTLMNAVTNNMQVKVNRLPLTGEMGEDLKNMFGNDIKVITGTEANEKNIKTSDMSAYRYILFGTHGIMDNDIPYILEPALILSLVNNTDQDGFLTMSEVMDMKLNTDTTVLSACKTGLGKTLTGEGVMGMGRAFQFAGSKSVVMSLWSVESKSVNIMTEKFFEGLKAGKSNSEALKDARAYIRSLGYEHPFYWAPFILIGD